MKKITVRIFVLALTLAGMSVSAQEGARPTKKANISESLMLKKYQAAKKLRIENFNEAVKLAKQNNWPLVVEEPSGKRSTLVRVTDNDTPIYITTSNSGSAITSRANYLQPGGDSGLNLTGEYEDGFPILVGIWDGGHPMGNHEALDGRTTVYDGVEDVQYHPTHVTGTVIGGAIRSRAKGLAQKATVASFDYYGDYEEMVAFAHMFILSNHSYGYNEKLIEPETLRQIRGSYIKESQEIDDVTFDNPYYQPVLAAGNAGNVADGEANYDRLTDMSTSKNGITVAAVHEVLSYADPMDVLQAGFTSCGPTNDKRIKPDISSKGVDVYSATNAGYNLYVEESGTSMAAPGVTGALILVQQYFANLHTPVGSAEKTYMRSSTLRGLIAHTADEAGLAAGPDPVFGWGLLNIKRAVEVLGASYAKTTSSVEELVLTPGQVYTKTVSALGSEPLVATIAWTDPAGAITTDSSTPVLVNDLDITVTKGVQVNYPWRLDSSGYYAERGENSVDNIEKVEIDNASGTYTITVKHKKSTLKNPNGTPQQVYSLIVSGKTKDIVGLDESVVKMFNLWPNPAGEELHISFPAGVEQNASAVVYDAQGRSVLSVALLNSDNVLNVQGLAKGIYMVNVTNGKTTDVEKVIIK